MVDRYIPNIAMCLRDDSELVRKQTLMLLTRLLQVLCPSSLSLSPLSCLSLLLPSPLPSLFAACPRPSHHLAPRSSHATIQEDYVKWKGQLFYRFVVALVDPSQQIRDFGMHEGEGI